MALLDRLQRIGPEASTITVEAPELGDGEKVTFATRLTVGDVLALPASFFALSSAGQSALLFRLLAREANGEPMQAKDDDYMAVDGMALHAIVRRADLHRVAFEQLHAEDAAGEGKSSP